MTTSRPVMKSVLDPNPSVLWIKNLDGVVATCDVRFVPIGVEVRMLRNERLLMSRIFPSGDEALAWAEEERLAVDQSEGSREPPHS